MQEDDPRTGTKYTNNLGKWTLSERCLSRTWVRVPAPFQSFWMVSVPKENVPFTRTSQSQQAREEPSPLWRCANVTHVDEECLCVPRALRCWFHFPTAFLTAILYLFSSFCMCPWLCLSLLSKVWEYQCANVQLLLIAGLRSHQATDQILKMRRFLLMHLFQMTTFEPISYGKPTFKMLVLWFGLWLGEQLKSRSFYVQLLCKNWRVLFWCLLTFPYCPFLAHGMEL